MRSLISRAALLMGMVGVVAVLAGCGSSSSSSGSGSSASAGSSGGVVTVGASLPLTGLAAEPSLKLGYEQAVTDQNAKGGIMINGHATKVKLVVTDNQSDPTTMVQQLRQMVQSDHVAALLGPCCQLDIQAAEVANELHVPMMQTTLPTEIAAGSQKGDWSWTVFQNAQDQATQYFEPGGLASKAHLTSKKFALLSTNDASGELWTHIVLATAKRYGWTAVVSQNVPGTASDFSGFITKLRSDGVEAVRVNLLPPDGIALWKQMKSLGYHPQIADCTLCDGSGAWGKALGATGEGVMTPMWWTPTSGQQQAKRLSAIFAKQYPNVGDQAQAVATYDAAQVLFSAIGSAGGTTPTAINTAIGKTDGEFALGKVKFTKGNVATTPSFWGQWRNGQIVQVYPKSTTAPTFPTSGLQ